MRACGLHEVPERFPMARRMKSLIIVSGIIALTVLMTIVAGILLRFLPWLIPPPKPEVLRWYTADRLQTFLGVVAPNPTPQGEETTFLVTEVRLPARMVGVRQEAGGWSATIPRNPLKLITPGGPALDPAFGQTPSWPGAPIIPFDFPRAEWDPPGECSMSGPRPAPEYFTLKLAFPVRKHDVELGGLAVQFKNYPPAELTQDKRAAGK
jgi:hypothetical protein